MSTQEVRERPTEGPKGILGKKTYSQGSVISQRFREMKVSERK